MHANTAPPRSTNLTTLTRPQASSHAFLKTTPAKVDTPAPTKPRGPQPKATNPTTIKSRSDKPKGPSKPLAHHGVTAVGNPAPAAGLGSSSAPAAPATHTADTTRLNHEGQSKVVDLSADGKTGEASRKEVRVVKRAHGLQTAQEKRDLRAERRGRRMGWEGEVRRGRAAKMRMLEWDVGGWEWIWWV